MELLKKGSSHAYSYTVYNRLNQGSERKYITDLNDIITISDVVSIGIQKRQWKFFPKLVVKLL